MHTVSLSRLPCANSWFSAKNTRNFIVCKQVHRSIYLYCKEIPPKSFEFRTLFSIGSPNKKLAIGHAKCWTGATTAKSKQNKIEPKRNASISVWPFWEITNQIPINNTGSCCARTHIYKFDSMTHVELSTNKCYLPRVCMTVFFALFVLINYLFMIHIGIMSQTRFAKHANACLYRSLNGAEFRSWILFVSLNFWLNLFLSKIYIEMQNSWWLPDKEIWHTIGICNLRANYQLKYMRLGKVHTVRMDLNAHLANSKWTCFTRIAEMAPRHSWQLHVSNAEQVISVQWQ